MAKTDLEILKSNLMEAQFPYFTDPELEALLEDNGGGVKKASYQGCLKKAQNDGISLGKININSNEAFWLRQARMFAPVRTTGMSRADE